MKNSRAPLTNCHQQLELGALQWQAADGSVGKARNGGDQTGPQFHRSRQARVKKSLLDDAHDGPLAIVVARANVNGHLLLEEMIEAIVVERPWAAVKRTAAFVSGRRL